MDAHNTANERTNAARPKLADWMLVGCGVIYLTLLYFKPVFELMADSESSLSRVNLVAMVLVAFAVAWQCGARTVRTGELVFICGAALVFIISHFYRTFTPLNFDILFQIEIVLRPIIIYVCFARISENRWRGGALLIMLGTLACLNGGVALWGALTHSNLMDMADPTKTMQIGVGAFGYDANTGRSGGIQGENYAAYWIAPLLALGISWILSNKRLLIGWVIVLFSCAVTLVSMSRASVLGLIVAVLLGTWIWWSKITQRQGHLLIESVGLAVLAVSVLLVGALFWKYYIGAMEENLLEAQGERWRASLQDSRLELYQHYGRLALDRLLTGSGPGFIEDYSRSGQQNVPHSSLLDVLVEFGIFGLLLYLVPFWQLRRALIRVIRGEGGWRQSTSILALTAMGVSLMFLSFPFGPLLWVVVGIATGICIPNRLGLARSPARGGGDRPRLRIGRKQAARLEQMSDLVLPRRPAYSACLGKMESGDMPFRTDLPHEPGQKPEKGKRRS